MQSADATNPIYYVNGVAHAMVNGELVREDGAEVAPKGDRPTAKQIDVLVELFEASREEADLATERFNQHKDTVIALVQRFGIVPKGAESSLRLEGVVTILTVTTGNTIAIKEDAVHELKGAMEANGRKHLFASMFGERVKFELLKGAEEALRLAKLNKRLIDKFNKLYARCFDVKKKSPSLKVERLGDKKPAKKGGR
jgi:hypothetical protein